MKGTALCCAFFYTVKINWKFIMKNILKRFVIATVIIVGINWVIDIVIASIRRLNG